MTTTLATNITSYDAKPPVVVDSKIDKGFPQTLVDTVEAPILALNDIVILSRVPVDAILHTVLLGTDDLGTAGVLDFGYYKKNADGTYTAVSANALASGLDVNTAAVAMTDRRFSAHNIDTVMKKAWELAGLSARPAYDYLYLGLKATTATTAGGTISTRVSYSA